MGILKKGDEPKKEKKNVNFELNKNVIFNLKETHYPKGEKKASRADTHSPRKSINLDEMSKVKEYLENFDDTYKGYVLVQYASSEEGVYTLTFADPAIDLAENPDATRYFKRTFMPEMISEILAKPISTRPKLE